MDPVKRILVHVCKNGAVPQRAPFLQSVTGFFSGDDQAEVSCSLDKNQFIISGGDGGPRVPLKVAMSNQMKRMVFYTTIHHLCLCVQLLDAGLRELHEETGLKLKPDRQSSKILGLWESVYPPLLSCGPPQRHHVIVYMLLHSPLSHLHLQTSLSPAPCEVSACLWADRKLIRAIVSAVDGEDGDVDLTDLPTSISVSQVSAHGALTDATVPLAVLVSRTPDTERVSTGTKFALGLWQQSLDAFDP
ncbi:hypothetical protein fugu_009507 [Takifugu bimaculatus]|uniref:Nudix hydrolase domain-containing protein n=1 Tax=Takifugu bimaculatus TaxID=433685 RepID=A0A4Z2CD04_9TELE|nr:hypothetical protein fugu_009507 [Takifugu bimaculatus]